MSNRNREIEIHGPYDCAFESLGLKCPPDHELEAAKKALEEYHRKGEAKTLAQITQELGFDWN